MTKGLQWVVAASVFATANQLWATGTATTTITAEDLAGHSSLTNRLNWTDASAWTAGVTSGTGAWTGFWQPDPTTDYLVYGKTVRTPRFKNYSFVGKSLTIGTQNPYNYGNLGIGDPAQTSTLTFENDGLVFANGAFGQFYGQPTTVNGKLRIEALPQNNGTTRFRLSTNNRMPAGDAAGVAGLTFTGAVTGDVGTLLQMHIYDYSENYNNCTATNSIYRFTGDLSGCHTTFRVRPWSNQGQYEWPDNRRAVFSTSSATMPGTVELWRGGAIQLYSASQSFALGSLMLSGDNLVDVPYDFATGRGATLDVTGSLSQTGNPALVRIRFSGTDTSSTVRFAVLKAPAGVTLEQTNFVLEPLGSTFRLEVADDTDGRSTLWLVRSKVIRLGQSDAANARESFCEGSIKSHGWLDVAANQWPTAGNDYLVEGLTLRTPNPQNITFAGDALKLLASTKEAVLACRASVSMTIPKLFMRAEAANVTFSHYASGAASTKTSWPYPESGLCLVSGDAEVSTSPGANGKICFNLSTGRGFKYEMPLHGTAVVAYEAYCESTQNAAPIGHHWLTVPNPDLKGQTILRYKANNTWTKSDMSVSIPVPSMDYSARVYIEDPLCFGGPLDTFNFQALQIEDYSVLHPMRSMTFDDPTRGIQIANMLNGGAPVARFDVTNDVVFTIKQKLNFASAEATLIKEGAGLLVFGAGCKPTFWNDQNESPSVSSNNLFRIAKGSFQPAAHQVCDGLQVSFAEGTKMILDARTTDANLLKYGLYNEIYRRGRTDRTGADVYPGKPLSLAAGATEYAIEIRDADYATTRRPVRKIGLVTVGNEYADEIAGKLKVTSPYTGSALTIETDVFDAPIHGGKLVTFSAVFSQGLIVVFR